MSTRRSLAIALATGAAAGLAWWILYVPPIVPLPILLGSHAAGALIVERLLYACGTPWRDERVLVSAIVAGFFIMPAWLAPLRDVGLLVGATTYVLGAVAIVAGAAVAAGIGRLTRSRPLVGLLMGTLVLGALLGSDAALLRIRRSQVTSATAAVSTAGFPHQKVAILGIDGGDWQVAAPMMRRGELPHLAALVNGGRWGVLRSEVPAWSPVVWTTMLSGHPPEVHGLRSWFGADARNLRVPMLWDIFGAQGRSSVVVNVPGTWPPAAVKAGVVISGFPIPGLVTGDTSPAVGQVLTTDVESGAVATRSIGRLRDGRYRVDVPFALPHLRSRIPHLRHAYIDLLLRKRLLQPDVGRLRFDIEAADGEVRLYGGPFAHPMVVQSGHATPWMRYHQGAIDAVFRIRVLDAEADRVRLFLSPPFQSPDTPRYRFVSGLSDPSVVLPHTRPYIVEGLGWTAHHDPRVAFLVPDALYETERGHLAAVEALLDRHVPDLLVYVITVTDRIQHAFWTLHTTGPSAPLEPVPPGLDKRDPVAEAWQLVDEALGEIVTRFGDDALIMVVSDHGFQRRPDAAEGTHRAEGMWVAHGPSVRPAAAPHEMKLLDVVPTILRCIGAPGAADFPGGAAAEICPGATPPPPIATYRQTVGALPAARAPHVIDESTKEQLRSLGYVE